MILYDELDIIREKREKGILAKNKIFSWKNISEGRRSEKKQRNMKKVIKSSQIPLQNGKRDVPKMPMSLGPTRS